MSPTNTETMNTTPRTFTMLQRMIDETANGGTPCLLTLEHARQAIEENAKERKAFADLHHYAELVLSDLNDRKTGWYYQFSAAVEKIRNHYAPKP
jgi:hypothetical protein